MAKYSPVATLLKQTSKGKLHYDKDWYDMGKLQDILTELSSPPAIKHYSPTAATCLRTSFIKDDIINVSQQEDESRLNDTQIVEDKEQPRKSKVTDPIIYDRTSPEVFKAQKAINDYEHEWDDKVKSLVEERSRKFREHSEKLSVESQNKVYQYYNKLEHDAVNFLQQAEAQNKLRLDEIKEKHRRLREHHERHAQMLGDKMRKAEEMKRQLEIEEEKIRQEVLNEQINSIAKVVKEIKDRTGKLESNFKDCKYPELLGDSGTKYSNVAKQIALKAQELQKQALANQQSQVLQELANKLLVLLKSATSTEENSRTIVAAVNKKGEEDAEKQKAAAAAAAAASVPTAAATPQAPAVPQVPGTSAAPAATSVSSKILTGTGGVPYVSEDGLKLYTHLQDRLTEIKNSYSALASDPQLKKYMLDLQKAVNTPVNTIAPTSGSHLRDKLNQVCALLSGHTVEVGSKRMTATQHPAAINFCKELFARKIVCQGVEQVSSNHESAFAIASVAVGVWCEHPDVGELMLAHFHKLCPYIVPYYKQLLKGQTEEDYYRELGYKYIDGVVEQQDKFLKRMTGLMRLYASLLVATPPRASQHPHGIQHAWMWLTSTMNLDPRPDITATMIYDLLEVTGNSLWKTYGKQFLKLLQVLYVDYVQRIRNVSQQSGGGPLSRLENYLQNCISSGQISPPKGILHPNFWYT